jgi:hypothetical protein
MLPDAATQVKPALEMKNYGFLYADGPDYVHVRAYSG